MADETTDPHATHEGDENEYLTERQRRLKRFVELGGNEPIQLRVNEALRRPILADQITPRHRELVSDLASAGLSNEAISRILGISKERLQTLFEYELGTGFELAAANMAGVLVNLGLAGDGTAAVNWLKYHNRSQWAQKSELSEKGAIQDKEGAEAEAAANAKFLAALTEGLMTSEKHKRPARAEKKIEPKKGTVEPKKGTNPTTIKKVKGD